VAVALRVTLTFAFMNPSAHSIEIETTSFQRPFSI
jgi:hypothetical protein